MNLGTNEKLFPFVSSFIFLSLFLFVPQGKCAELVDDFSYINQYNVAGSNPYAQYAQSPLWGSTGNPGDDAYHTNNLGYREGSGIYPDRAGSDGLSQSESGGCRSISWDSTATAWWYTLLSLSGNSRDIASYKYLTFKIKGAKGGERFKVKLETKNKVQESYIDTDLSVYVTNDWQVAKIPLSKFNTITQADLTQATAITLVFFGGDAQSGGSKIYYDDIALTNDADYTVPASDGVAKPQSTGSVKVILETIQDPTRKITVNDQRYLIKGVGYSPIPFGKSPDMYLLPDILSRDMPNMKNMGINTIRTWDKLNKDLLDLAYSNNMRACAGFWIPYEISFLNEWAKQRMKDAFVNYVSAYKDHPGLLMWVIGNENNFTNGCDWHYYNFINELAKAAYTTEGSGYHPVAIVEGDIDPYLNQDPIITIGDSTKASDDAHINYVDIVGVNSYRGYYFDSYNSATQKTIGLFDSYKTKTQKPLWISEFGADAYDNVKQTENQGLQNYFAANSWIDVVRNNSVCIGATLMEYSDEWWKWPGDVAVHDLGGFDINKKVPPAKEGFANNSDGTTDRIANEEWWGVFSIQDNGDNPDILTARKVYYNLYSTTVGGKINNTFADLNTLFGSSSNYYKVVMVPSSNAKRQYEAIIDQNALYCFTQVDYGIYTVYLANPVGKKILCGNINVTQGSAAVLDITINAGTVTISKADINSIPNISNNSLLNTQDPVYVVDEGKPLTFTIPVANATGYCISGLPTTGVVAPNLNISTGIFSWTPNYTQAGTYPVTFTIIDSSKVITSKTVTIKVNNVSTSINGWVTYENSKASALKNVKLELKDSGNNVIATITTDNNGYYAFNNIKSGTYTIQASSTASVGGIDPADALLVNRYYILLYTFPTELKKLAADVNLDKKINPTDALLINRFYIKLINSFKAGAWLFENKAIPVAGEANVSYSLKGICVGDVNGSYIPQ